MCSTAETCRACRSASCRGCAIARSASSSRASTCCRARRRIENVELPMLYRPPVPAKERHQRAAAALEAVGLGERLDHHPNQLSGGQQQRVAIARALVNNPSLLLADEPTGNLDSRTSIEVMGIFQRLNAERGITIVLVTHEPDIAEYATRIIGFRDGRVRLDRPVAAAPRRGRRAAQVRRRRRSAVGLGHVTMSLLMTFVHRRHRAPPQCDANGADRARHDHRRRRRDRHGGDRQRRALVDREPHPQRRHERRDGLAGSNAFGPVRQGRARRRR